MVLGKFATASVTSSSSCREVWPPSSRASRSFEDEQAVNVNAAERRLPLDGASALGQVAAGSKREKKTVHGSGVDPFLLRAIPCPLRATTIRAETSASLRLL